MKSPFKLLEPYSASEKNLFFGRDAEIFALYHLLKQTRLALVYGASGTGKTSLIQAGLPKVFKVSDWLPIFIRRKSNINDSINATLSQYAPNDNSINQSIQTIYEDRWMPIYLVFDQFEEIFTLGHEEERRKFFDTLQSIISSKLPCKVILSMREEYIGHLYDYEPQVPTLFDKRFRVEPMNDGMVKQVISKMCTKYGISLAQGDHTVEQILDQIKLGKQAAYLPYLQIYLHYLYEHAIEHYGKPIFKEEGINAIGQLGDVLNQFIDSQTSAAQAYLSQFGVANNFAELLLDEFATSEGTKQSQLKSHLINSLSANEQQIEEALNYFSNTAKLLRADENEIDRYEPVHDVVAKQIHELRTTENKEYKEFERKLEQDYVRWNNNNQNTDLLLRSIDLNKVEVFEEKLKRKEKYESTYALFIEKSITNVQKQKRRRQVLIGFLTITTIAAITAGLLANHQRKEANLAFEQFKNEQAQKVLSDVNQRRQRALILRDSYPEIANFMIDDIKEILVQYQDNPALQDTLKVIENIKY